MTVIERIQNEESIFEYIDNHIKKNGTLSKDFNLDDYLANDEEKDLALGALDGLSYFHTKIDSSSKSTRFLKSLFKDLNMDNVSLKSQKLEAYFKTLIIKELPSENWLLLGDTSFSQSLSKESFTIKGL